MPRFSANLSTLFTERPFLERFAAAAAAGFRAVEFQFAYDEDPGAIRAALEVERLALVLINAPAGDLAAGERGLAALPGREAAFEASLAQALDLARALGRPFIHVLAGVPGADVAPAKARATYVANLRAGAAEAARAGATLLIEPINRRDIPGYFLAHTGVAREIVETVAADNLGLQLDFYHRQIMEGDLSAAWAAHRDITRHIQIANPPDRGEPDRGEIDHAHLFAMLDGDGYDGWVGAEYAPRGRTEAGLGWFAPWAAAR